MSSGGGCSLYGLRLMHRLNIFLSCFGHSGWAGSFFMLVHGPNPNLRIINKCFLFCDYFE
ncbi:hypothetical protein BJ165DRAFT_1466696 [Panaeolus papilionaceus]|nr:hypothetical protein BJ165DRAFT_1466696 [Panaeolus papilionaceus]